MWKIISFVLILNCVVTFGAPSAYEELALKVMDTKLMNFLRRLRYITIEELTPVELALVEKTAQQADVTIDDALFYIRAEADSTLNMFDSLGSPTLFDLHYSKFDLEFGNMRNALAYIQAPRDVTLENLSKNYGNLLNHIARQLNAPVNDIVYVARYMILMRNFNKNEYISLLRRDTEDMVLEMQREKSICPTLPPKGNDKPSSEEIRKYITQSNTFDGKPDTPLVSQIADVIKKTCGIPDAVVKKIVHLSDIWIPLLYLNLGIILDF